MSKIYMPSHKDGGNRGCEAITRGTAKILDCPKDWLIGYSNNLELDIRLGVTDNVLLQRMRTLHDENVFDKVKRKVRRKLIRDEQQRLIFDSGVFYDVPLKQIGKSDVALSTGGDMFCYENNEVIYINNSLHRRGVKTVLWGCSIGRNNLTPEKIDTLKKFSAITVRESLTQQVLIEQGIQNVYLYPDPAFVLEPEKCELPKDAYAQEVVGINLSNFVGENVGFDTAFGKNLLHLVEYILEKTQMNIMLIPHVFWEGQDDRVVCEALYRKYAHTGRIFLLDSEKMNYCQIRYVISKCRFFIGARTHSMISAYSTSVPALALGYSIKARGIARDLGLSEKLVVDWQALKEKSELTTAFQYMVDNEREIREIYKTNLKLYTNRAYEAKEVIDKVKGK